MMRALITKTLFVLFVAAVMTGCKIAVIVPSGGQLFASNPAHSCSEGRVCEFDINAGQLPFSESFTAIPKEGYGFEKWSDGSGFLCGKSTNPTCTVNIPDNAVGAILVALFDSGYVMPIFKNVGIDTDSDGVRNELDEDDDNDGIFDADDACPLDANLNCGINEVSGIISEDTTWSEAIGPISLTGNVQISPGVTLTILEGATIIRSSNCISGRLEVFGSLVVQGSEQNPVEFPEGLSLDASLGASESIYIDFANIRSDGCASRLTNFNNDAFSITNSLFESVNGTFSSSDFETIFEKNIVGPGSYFEFNRYGSSGDSELIIRNNVFNGALVALSGSSSRLVFENNTLISEAEAEAIALFNHFSDPAGYNLPNNYWGTTDAELVDVMIRDRSDNLNIPGYVAYMPILGAPHPDTPTGL
jgi:hypothetical protein